MNLTRCCVAVACCLLVVSCSWPVQMMPRDAGTVYRGVANGNGMGSGTMSVDIDGRLYSGPMFRTASSDAFGFFRHTAAPRVLSAPHRRSAATSRSRPYCRRRIITACAVT